MGHSGFSCGSGVSGTRGPKGRLWDQSSRVQRALGRTSLWSRGLGLCLPMQGAGLILLVVEIKIPRALSAKNPKQNRHDVANQFNKDFFKIVKYQTKNLKKKKRERKPLNKQAAGASYTRQPALKPRKLRQRQVLRCRGQEWGTLLHRVGSDRPS